MDALFKKLNFKSEKEVLVLQAPKSLEENMQNMSDITTFQTDIEKAETICFAIVFVTKQQEIEKAIRQIATKIQGDAIIWFCYPKMSSKKYTCEFNRDNGWAVMGDFDFEPVRQVAIDEDWSALRFRNIKYIKKITRRESFALTKEAKDRTTQKGV